MVIDVQWLYEVKQGFQERDRALYALNLGQIKTTN